MKVAIIGAGPAGMVSARYAAEQGFNCTVFEQTDKVGGTWNYTDKTGIDENGLAVHSSMYKGVTTNLPKEAMTFPDFPYPMMKISYISQQDVLDYINNYAKHFDIFRHVKFNSHIKKIQPAKDGKWKIFVWNVKTKAEDMYLYDAVMICNGHYSNPFFPSIKGAEYFKDRNIHSHDYRDCKAFSSRKVLIVGAGPSGIDITNQISTVAEKVYISYTKMTLNYELPKSVVHKPKLKELLKGKAVFQDDTVEEIDEIIYCTGYNYSYPFLTEDCGIRIDQNFVNPLYKHIININYPTMAFIGIPSSVCIFHMVDLQARFFLSALTGHFYLPSQKLMLNELEADIKTKQERGVPKNMFHVIGQTQRKYFTDLAVTANIKGVAESINKLYSYLAENMSFSYRFDIINDEDFVAEKLE